MVCGCHNLKCQRDGGYSVSIEVVHDTYPGVSTCQRAHHSSSLCNYKRQYIKAHTCTSKILYSHPRPPQIMEVAKPTVSPTTHSMVPALDCLPPTISASAPNFFLTLVCLHTAKRPTTLIARLHSKEIDSLTQQCFW